MSLFVFYSWQSDTDKRTNRFFIKSALEQAIAELNKEIELQVQDSERQELQIDHDTQGVPGSPPITDTIFNKIDNCGIFLADLTYVARVPDKHGVSNPNVLTERGYALKSIGHKRIIAVMNTAHGAPDDLPFDLRGVRWPIIFNLSSTDSNEKKKQEKKFLVDQFKIAITTVLNSGAIKKETKNSIETLKEIIKIPEKIIQIDSIVRSEIDSFCKSIKNDNFSLIEPPYTNEEAWDRSQEYEKLLSNLLSLIIICGYWGDEHVYSLMEDAICYSCNASLPKDGRFYREWDALALLPSFILFYASGIAALKNKKYLTLSMLFTNIYLKIASKQDVQSISTLSPAYIPLTKHLTGFFANNYGSKYLQEVLHNPLIQFFRDDKEYNYYFGLFELIYNLVFIYQRTLNEGTHHHLFCSLNFQSPRTQNGFSEFKSEVEKLGSTHPLLKAGLFDGKLENLQKALGTIYDTEVIARAT